MEVQLMLIVDSDSLEGGTEEERRMRKKKEDPRKKELLRKLLLQDRREHCIITPLSFPKWQEVLKWGSRLYYQGLH